VGGVKSMGKTHKKNLEKVRSKENLGSKGRLPGLPYPSDIVELGKEIDLNPFERHLLLSCR
jgi:hypothetical protein